MTHSLFWHDYETTGTHPQKDRPLQFAGLRTDLNFNVIDDPVSIFCKLSLDILPHPDACLITKITPQLANEKGVNEAEFVRLIHEQLAQPHTCSLGYNSIRFDDEMTRHALYRNFYDAYEREWQHGNSRWDLLDVFRAAQALRPDGFKWVYDDERKPIFKLDQLTVSNNIPHNNAHDALADVYALLSLAQLLRRAQPRLFQFLFEHRTKAQALKLLAVGTGTPACHISGMYPATQNCLAIVLPLCVHPKNANEIIVYDLSVDPTPLLTLSAEEIQQRLFVATEDLPENVARIPLKTVHINKCPVLAPMSVLRAEDVQRLGLDVELCLKNGALLSDALKQIPPTPLQKGGLLTDKIAAVFNKPYADSSTSVNVDLALYSGGFFSAVDKKAMTQIRNTAPEKLATLSFRYEDARLPEMLFRYRARNFPNTLTGEEWHKWREFCVSQLTQSDAGANIVLNNYLQRVQVLHEQGADTLITKALLDYAHEKMQHLEIKI
ncbi:MAG: exodeoxyribonuclease I [Methylococcales bacterium]|nr:exodeoxyribonuclease I [Methylococcales bacterium]MDD5753761.1 exodeoxyribonuclease I [Methylococcales bacterium]